MSSVFALKVTIVIFITEIIIAPVKIFTKAAASVASTVATALGVPSSQVWGDEIGTKFFLHVPPNFGILGGDLMTYHCTGQKTFKTQRKQYI